MFLRRQKQTARRCETERLWRGRNSAKCASAGEGERLFGRPKRIGLRARLRQNHAVGIDADMRQPLSIWDASFNEPVIRRRPEEPARPLRYRPGQGEAERRRPIGARRRTHFNQARICLRAKIWERLIARLAGRGVRSRLIRHQNKLEQKENKSKRLSRVSSMPIQPDSPGSA